MQPGSLVIGDTLLNYGNETLKESTNIAGMLLNCKDKTEIAVHDALDRVVSLIAYDSNKITIGRNMAWGAIGSVEIVGNTKIMKDITLGSSTTTDLNTHLTIGSATIDGGHAIMGYKGRGPNEIINAATYWKGGPGNYATDGFFGIAVNDYSKDSGDANGITEGELTSQTHFVIKHDGNVGIGTTTPTEKLEVNGNIKVAGNVDVEGLSVANKYEKSITGTYSAADEIDIFDGFVEKQSGIYIVVVYLDNRAASGGHWYYTYSSVPFYWHGNGGTNGSVVQELPPLYGSGHASNSYPVPTIKLCERPSSRMLMKLVPNTDWNSLDGTVGKTVNVYLKQIA